MAEPGCVSMDTHSSTQKPSGKEMWTATVGDSRRGGKEPICAIPLHSIGKYNIFLSFELNKKLPIQSYIKASSTGNVQRLHQSFYNRSGSVKTANVLIICMQQNQESKQQKYSLDCYIWLYNTCIPQRVTN